VSVALSPPKDHSQYQIARANYFYIISLTLRRRLNSEQRDSLLITKSRNNATMILELLKAKSTFQSSMIMVSKTPLLRQTTFNFWHSRGVLVIIIMEYWKVDVAFNNYQMVFMLGPFDKLVLRNCVGRQHPNILVVLNGTCY